ncbi:MAG TPA: M55 family metallopeptidase [Plantibacter sp.]|uniref:M55 family metallopeptidase n=1 Tax=unclassified Plantibacter TaxID=2624265 RepID=UPI002CA17DF8|nr:M55 family metallopeptidase [Plantibacter sp.]
MSPTKVYMSVDMEGIAGIATFDQVVRGGHGYPRSQELMTLETNAAIAGAFAGGATEVVVNDSHGTMDNLLHELLDPRARLVFGSPKLQCMAEGLTADCDVALFVGYHAPAGGPGVLAHTFSSHFTGVRINGVPVSEAEVNALYAASLGVPVGLVTGDDVICALAAERIPGVAVAEVKVAHGFAAANTLAPSVARDLVRDAAERAVRGHASLPRPQLPGELVLEVDLPLTIAAEMARGIPGVERVGDRTVRRTLSTTDEVIGIITVYYQLAAAAVAARQALISRI